MSRMQNGEFLDGGGVCGSTVHYGIIFFLVGSAFLIFLYLWKKGKLDMDEEPKITMMKKDEDPEFHPDDEGDNRGGA